MTATIPGWPEVADRVIKRTPLDRLHDFKLMWREPQPCWASPNGRVVQIGDAAHTFLPSSGSGATQGIEDAVSIAACLGLAGKDNVPWASKVHSKLRLVTNYLDIWT
jgi:2-polyprenyl-6-methoxyphenol hydroxylase-like FAD-dependent oxidoreductase